MFSPFSAFTSTVKGAEEGFTDPKLMNQLGIQALGRALQSPMGGMAEQGPQPPPPGQASMPMQPPPQQAGPPPGPPPQQGQGPMPMGPEMNPSGPMAQQPASLQGGFPPGVGGPPPMQGAPQGMPQQRAPQGMPPPPPQMQQTPQGMMPQMDLQTLIQRVHQANPGLPPQAMVAALTNAVPLLNVQGRHDLQMLQLQQKYDNMQLRQDLTTQTQNAISQRWGDRDTSSGQRNDARIEGQNARTDTTEAGRNNRAELSRNTRLEVANLSAETRREIEDARTGRAQLSADARREIATMNIDARREITSELEAGRNSRSQATIASREGEGAANRTSREGIVTTQQEGANARNTERVEGAGARTEATIASREGEGAANRTSREGIATAAETGRQGRFTTREGRLDDQYNRTYDRLVQNAQQRWDINEKKLQQAMTLANTREGRMKAIGTLRTLEQEALANHRAVMEKIQAGFLPNAKDKNALVAEANAKRDAFMAKIEQYRQQLKEGGAPQQAPASPAAPAGPPQTAAPGGGLTNIQHDGKGNFIGWDGKAWVPAPPPQ